MKTNAHRQEPALAQHNGIFRRQIGFWEGVALIVSSTVGAGVLGVPYAIAQVGISIGLVYIFGLGILLIGLNLLLGEIVIRTKQSFQLSGLARKYLGKSGEWVITGIIYLTMMSVLVVYLIGEGEILAELFGGSSFFWSAVFFCIAGMFITIGIHTIKVVEMILTLGIICIVLFIVFFSAPHIALPHIGYTNLANIFLPYGVVLFAYSGTASIPEVYTLLKNNKRKFKKAIVTAGVINMTIYTLFALAVVGVTGAGTTEIATIGLGNTLGPVMFLLGNLFALFAMGTSFLINGLALRDSLTWDYRIPRYLASLLVVGVPFIIFLLGLRQFIVVIDFVGGVFMSTTMLMIILIYWRAKQKGDLPVGKYRLHHVALLVFCLVLALSLGAIYSIVKLF